MNRRVGLVAPIVLVLIALSACASTPAATGPREGGSRVDATATPAPTERPLVVPDATIPVTCADALPPDAVRRVLQQDAAPEAESPWASAAAEDRQGGSLSCSWRATVSYPGDMYVIFSIYRHVDLVLSQPASGPAVDPRGTGAGIGADLSSQYSRDHGNSGVEAGIGGVVGDYGISLVMQAPTGTDPVARMREPVRDLVARLRAAGNLPTWTRQSGAWPSGLDCSTIAGRADVGAVLAEPALTVHDTTGQGEDYQETRDLATIGGRVDCTWASESTTRDQPLVVVLTTIAGGGWALEDHAKRNGGTPIEVKGADAAVMRCDESGCGVDARIGQNLIHVGPGLYTASLSEEQATSTTAALATALRATYGD